MNGPRRGAGSGGDFQVTAQGSTETGCLLAAWRRPPPLRLWKTLCRSVFGPQEGQKVN